MKPYQILIALLVASLTIWWLCQDEDPSAWEAFQAFQCRDCGGPAVVNPKSVDQWACPSCGYQTRDLWEHFAPDDTASPTDLRVAGCLVIPAEFTGQTPAEAWSVDRARHW